MGNAIDNWRRQHQDKKYVGKVGEILTWTELFVAPPGYHKDVPYFSILVKLDNGELRYGQLVDCNKENVTKGLKVRCVVRIIDGDATPEEIITYGLKFAPVQ